jgi:hypothetical protein
MSLDDTLACQLLTRLHVDTQLRKQQRSEELVHRWHALSRPRALIFRNPYDIASDEDND